MVRCHGIHCFYAIWFYVIFSIERTYPRRPCSGWAETTTTFAARRTTRPPLRRARSRPRSEATHPCAVLLPPSQRRHGWGGSAVLCCLKVVTHVRECVGGGCSARMLACV